MILQASLAGVALLHTADAGDRESDFAEMRHGLAIRHGIHELQGRIVNDARSCGSHDPSITVL